jgi:hypothetical protein
MADNNQPGGLYLRLLIKGFPSNRSVDHWVLGYNCLSGVVVDAGKVVLCNGTETGKSGLSFYSRDIYDPTSDYDAVSAVVQNKNASAATLRFSLDARDSADRSIGTSDYETVTIQPPSSVSTTPVTPAAVPPTVVSFNVSPTIVTQGQSIHWTGYARAGTAGILQYRAYVVGSNGGVGGAWTPANGASQVSFDSMVPTDTNVGSFYNGAGSYVLRFEVRDKAGLIAGAENRITVNPAGTPAFTGSVIPVTPSQNAGPVVSFSSSPAVVTQGDMLTWTGSVTASPGAYINRYRAYVVGSRNGAGSAWTLGVTGQTTASVNASISTAQNIASFYNGPGTYTMRLELEDTAGLSAYKDASVTINP